MRTLRAVPRPVSALLILSLIAAMVYAVVTLGPFQVNLTVGEPLSVSPETVTLSLYAGESDTETYTISNAASVTINVVVIASVTAFPTGGSAADVTLNYPSNQAVDAFSDATFDLEISIAQGAVAGSYTIEVTVSR